MEIIYPTGVNMFVHFSKAQLGGMRAAYITLEDDGTLPVDTIVRKALELQNAKEGIHNFSRANPWVNSGPKGILYYQPGLMFKDTEFYALYDFNTDRVVVGIRLRTEKPELENIINKDIIRNCLVPKELVPIPSKREDIPESFLMSYP